MREIKFRAWDRHENCIHSWERLLSMRYNERWFVDNTEKEYINCLFTDDSYTLEQYTGLKDKNGVEIYEGDIIRAHIICDGVATMGSIVFDSFLSTYSNKNDAGLTPLYKLSRFEVIGNIHQNPELLK